MRLIVAITGSSGVIYGIKMLEYLRALKVETHLVMSEWGEKNIEIETEKSVSYVRGLASVWYDSKIWQPQFQAGRSRPMAWE